TWGLPRVAALNIVADPVGRPLPLVRPPNLGYPTRSRMGPPGDRWEGVMGTPCRLAVGIALGLAGLATAQESPYGRATTLPTTELHAGLPDYTPPELLRPPPVAIDDSGPPMGGFYAAVEFLYLTP